MSSCTSDLTFGPSVSAHCRGGFDFTIKFEDIVLSLLPSSVFVVLAIARISYLFRAEPVTRGLWYRQLVKVVFATAYTALHLAVLILGTQLENETQLSTAARSLAFVSSVLILPLTILEDGRSKRPSFLLGVYLFFSALFDVVQTRTRWLVSVDDFDHVVLARLYTAAVAAKVVLLLLESQRKPTHANRSPEETSGPFGLVIYRWLGPLFFKGYRNVLSLNGLERLDEHIATDGLHEKLSARLPSGQEKRNMPRFTLAKALARTLLGPLLLSTLPRLCLVGFRFCQPFLVHSVLDYMEHYTDEDPAFKNAGYGFIGAAVFIFFGVAVSTALYWYCHERFISMTRGGLVAVIYERLIQLRTVDLNDSAAVTLMSTDIERIRFGLLNLHEFWAVPIEVALASWLLYNQLGVAFVAPLVVVICSVACSSVLNRYTGPRQKLWMERIQTRVAETAHMLSNMKQLKISALAQPVEESIQQLRENELQAAAKFRRLYVSNMAFGFAPMAICPVITFAITGRNLDTGTIFTSLAYLVLLANPLGDLFGEIPYLLAAFTSLDRIQEFLSKEGQSHHRHFAPPGSSSSSDSSGPKKSISPYISIDKANIGWTKDSLVFQDTTIHIQAASLTMLVGPVGSGKSTLCKALLAEIPFTDAPVQIGTAEHQFKAAFCDQAPYINNNSIRDNIIGPTPFDETRYREAVKASMLEQDLKTLPKGDGTVVGSGGVTLSGGQKQRIAIARALYQPAANFYVFDDSLSGLDADTELEVFTRVFGPDGILRRRKATVVLATHSVKHLPQADNIVVLGADSTVRYEGNYAGLIAAGIREHNEHHHPRKSKSDVIETITVKRAFQQDEEILEEVIQEDMELPSKEEYTAISDVEVPLPNNNSSFLSDKDRMTGDSTVYRYYLASLGKMSIIAFTIFGIGWGFFYNFGYIWLRFWSRDTSETNSRSFYLGIYGVWQFGGLASIILCYWTSYTMMAKISGSRLHRSALRSVIHAPLSFSTATDIGVITNLFSQDMTLIDNELPVAVTNLALDICNALGIAAVIATSSPYLAISYPVLMVVLYLVQKFYLRTARQLRLLDLEAKSPLYTHFLDTAKGLATIRAFGWKDDSTRAAFNKLDASQKPAYLLAMVQRWLLFVLLCIVAVLAILVVTLATQTTSQSTGFTGASLVSLMTFGDILNYIIRWWTQLETSIGAVTRLKALNDKVLPESFGDETQPVAPEWPARGVIEIEDVSASYGNKHTPDHLQPSLEQEKASNLVLANLSLSIGAGEKVAICGRSGSFRSGKSSLILLLLRMLDPLPSSSKNILVDGVRLHSISRAAVRNSVIAMSQDPVFLPGEISLKGQLDPFNVSTAAESHAVLHLVGLGNLAITEFGLDEILHPESLSGGQKQLFNLARTILRARARSRDQGGILLLDEVSASVDEQTEKTMLRIIMDEFESYTIIMVSHRLEMVMDFDTVLVMDRGRLMERGRPKVLAADERTQFGQLCIAGSLGRT
ncbi:ABC transporter [Apodospora peruviana]|uniref:ABC transporter n=1 Tax=Apodospora peruviana TaxID=516989 RepID=A0AAE0LY05_9PEZI|nr:ABC transporter [Apodospora peruviana]